jgi:hypothetical protein
MSASLIMLIPLVLLGLVGVLCFVGCGFPTSGLAHTLGPYATAINKINGLVAFWPLNDQLIGTIVPAAADVAPKPANAKAFDGQYSGSSGSSFKLNQTSIVPGDSGGGGCVSLNGINGFVNVPFAQALNPSSFTVEAWVQPGWTQADVMNNPMVRSVVASANGQPAAGWGLNASVGNVWQASIAIMPPAAGMSFLSVQSDQQIVLDGSTVYYLAMSFDATMQILTLLVGAVTNGMAGPLNTFPMPVPSGSMFQAEQSQQQPSTATPLFIGMGRPDMPTANQQPFKGSIQDVAFYNTALVDVTGHFNLGNTLPSDT